MQSRIGSFGMCWDFLGFRSGVWTEAAQGYQETSAFVGSCYPPVTFGAVRHSASQRLSTFEAAFQISCLVRMSGFENK